MRPWPAGSVMETERLRIRPMERGDAPFILRLLNEASFLRFIGDRGVRTLEDAEGYILVGSQSAEGEAGIGLRLVEVKAGGTPAGVCGIMRKPWLAWPDLAYAYVPEAEGQGYATEAARQVLAGAAAHGLGEIAAVVVPENVGSVRVLEKLAFRREGSVQDPRNGAQVDLFLHSPEV